MVVVHMILQDVVINRQTLTEALRLYFLSRDKESAIFQWVSEKPFLALNPTQKSEVSISSLRPFLQYQLENQNDFLH